MGVVHVDGETLEEIFFVQLRPPNGRRYVMAIADSWQPHPARTLLFFSSFGVHSNYISPYFSGSPIL